MPYKMETSAAKCNKIWSIKNQDNIDKPVQKIINQILFKINHFSCPFPECTLNITICKNEDNDKPLLLTLLTHNSLASFSYTLYKWSFIYSWISTYLVFVSKSNIYDQ